MQFQCDRCGKRYSTTQEIREGRSYRFKCRACANEVIVRGPPPSIPPVARPGGNGVVQAAAPPVGLVEPGPTPPPRVTTSVVQPGDLAPPEGGYVEFRLDDDVISQTNIPAVLPGGLARETPLPAEAEAAPAFSALASAGAEVSEPMLPDRPEAPPAAPRWLGPERKIVIAVVAASVVIGVVAASLLGMGSGGSRKGRAQAAAHRSAPGVITPTVYVGPVAFEEPTPQEEPSPPAPTPRAAARREAAPAKRGGREVAARPAAREVAARPAAREAAARPAARETASAPRAPAREAPAGVPPPAPVPEPGPAEAQAPVPPPLAPPPPPVAEPEPQPAPAAPAAVAPTPAPPAAGAALQPAADEEPVFARDGYRRPATQTPRCIEQNIRIAPDLADRLPPSVTMRFAVARDGTADLVQVLPGPDAARGERVDPRLAGALRSAVRGCRFVPGADDLGKPVRLWVVMQVRFAP